MKPLCIDLFCGLGGWSEGFIAEGWDCIGFDIERHDYGSGGYPGQLVLQDVMTLHGSQFKNADCIVASPPCQEYSYMAMPWSRAKRMSEEYMAGVRDIKKLTANFDACFRIRREAAQEAMRGIPLIVENVRGAERWLGPASWKYKSFCLWGDVPSLMPIPDKGFKGFKRNWRDCEASRKWSSRSKERKAWSAEIAKIPFALSRHIARAYKPVEITTPVAR